MGTINVALVFVISDAGGEIRVCVCVCADRCDWLHFRKNAS